ncbi:MAG: hypothetical protein ACRYF4_00565 [Janthinobacterium lividum]
MLFCDSKTNAAKRRYLQGSFGVMVSYLGFVASSRLAVNRWHPQGWHLYLAAALPTIPILCFAYIVGRYLREEHDEYQRDLQIRGMLWGSAVVLSITVFASFLRGFGWGGSLPPFTEFIVFWIVAGAVKMAYSFSNRGASDA